MNDASRKPAGPAKDRPAERPSQPTFGAAASTDAKQNALDRFAEIKKALVGNDPPWVLPVIDGKIQFS